MQKAVYLFKLRLKLILRFATKDVNNIMYDYNEYFEDGVADGKSVSDLVNSLGSTTNVVKSLEDERNILAPLKLLIRLFIGFFLLLNTLIYLDRVYSDGNMITTSIIFIFVSFGSIWILSGADFSKRVIRVNDLRLQIYKNLKRIIFLHLAVSAMSVLFILLSVLYIINYEKLPMGVPNTMSSFYFVPLFRTSSVVAFLAIIKIIKDYRTTNVNTYPLIFWILGVTYSVNTVANKFSVSTVGSDFFVDLWICIVPMLVGLVGAICSYFTYNMILKNRG